MKRIIFTAHASERLKQRKIKNDHVISTLADPDFIVQRGAESEAYKGIDKKLLKVIYVEKEKFIRIITLYWVNGNETKDKV